MSFNSSTQKNEASTLLHAMDNVENGFYLIFSSNDALVDSVLNQVTEAGWQGITLKPEQNRYAKLLMKRSGESDHQILVGDVDSTVEIFTVQGTVFSTTNKDLADGLALIFGVGIENKLYNMRTLNSICKEYNVQGIHFLVVDCDILENLILSSLDFKKYRPWIILVDTRSISSLARNTSTYELPLLANGYRKVHLEGFLYYYVAEEHAELIDRLCMLPSVEDGSRLWKNLQISNNFQELIFDFTAVTDQVTQIPSIQSFQLILFLSGVLKKVSNFGRKVKEFMTQLRIRMDIVARARRLILKMFTLSKGIFIVALLAERTKRRFPSVWGNLAAIIKGTKSTLRLLISNIPSEPEDEAHFLSLFQREIEDLKRFERGSH